MSDLEWWRRQRFASRVYASGRNFDNTTTTGIVEYVVGNHTTTGLIMPPPILLSLPTFNDTALSVNFTSQLRSLTNKKYPVDVPRNVTRMLFFTLSINLRPCDGPFDERFFASVNNVTMVLPRRSNILQAYYRRTREVYETYSPENPPLAFNYTQAFVPRDLWRPESRTDVHVLGYNSTVELVFQGTSMVSGIDYPMHLHGHNFYVVGWG